MSRAMAIFMVLAGLIAATYAATVSVNVGEGGLKFNPQNVTVNPGDILMFKWVSGPHSVIQSDAPAGSCAKSAAANAFSAPAQSAGTFNYTITQQTGKIWYYCGVGMHCQSGMWGVATIGGAAAPSGGAPASPSGGAPASPSGSSSGSPSSGGSSPSGTGAAAGSPSATHSAAGRSTTSFAAMAAGALTSSLLMAVLLL